MVPERQSRDSTPVSLNQPSSAMNISKPIAPLSPIKTPPKTIPTGPQKHKAVEADEPVVPNDPVMAPTQRSSRTTSKHPKVHASSPLHNHKPSSHPIQTISGIINDPKDITGKTLMTFKGPVYPLLNIFLLLC
jgi:hypothetical protein